LNQLLESARKAFAPKNGTKDEAEQASYAAVETDRKL
jgi:hypothetical protein